jgi:murein DD-endopeptidase MepM/ murein hydrolase activator NlpD
MSQQITFRLPFEGEWLTFWGGDTAELNHHHDETSQQFAFDFIQADAKDGFYRTDGQSLEDYYSYSAPVLASAGGMVVEAVDGLRDNPPGTINPYQILGNYVMIQHANKLFSVLGHLKQSSVSVKVGDSVSIGQKIGHCGNSGYSTDPHLHFHVQDSATFARIGKNWKKQNVAKGVKISFTNISVNGSPKPLHSPTKSDRIHQS